REVRLDDRVTLAGVGLAVQRDVPGERGGGRGVRRRADAAVGDADVDLLAGACRAWRDEDGLRRCGQGTGAECGGHHRYGREQGATHALFLSYARTASSIRSGFDDDGCRGRTSGSLWTRNYATVTRSV